MAPSCRSKVPMKNWQMCFEYNLFGHFCKILRQFISPLFRDDAKISIFLNFSPKSPSNRGQKWKIYKNSTASAHSLQIIRYQVLAKTKKWQINMNQGGKMFGHAGTPCQWSLQKANEVLQAEKNYSSSLICSAIAKQPASNKTTL